MKKNVVWLTAFLFALWFAGCSKKEAEEEHAEEHHSDVVTLTEEGIKLSGIKVEKISIRNVPVEFSAAGKVGFNEKKLVHITARTSGWVEKVYAFVGDRVKAGDSLASLYSPEFLSSQSEFIQAEERLKVVSPSDSAEYRTAQALYNSARSRLLLFSAGERELEALAETHRPVERLVIKSPITGNIVESNLIVGNTIERGANLFRISDLSSLWVIADVYEKDIKAIQKGQKVRVRTASLGGRAFSGTVEAVNDILDETTRTFKVRISVENLSGELKPEMFCECLFTGQSSRAALAVPSGAVQHIGEEYFVFVLKDSLSFEKRNVEIGEEIGGRVELVGGLEPGESVVTAGAFILKSELLKSEMGEEH
ncbi:MAG: efflux RND transporter periplasmic adaptor subunit [candidate division Zixibacteria bacterium]|nr:efflux RND transporter periplasmic adaptor subunit [candidate division Zixibacteria bacterium]